MNRSIFPNIYILKIDNLKKNPVKTIFKKLSQVFLKEF